ncbi:MAG: hypothetical protein ACRDY7_06640 [Acidimicrobiia bacterium]
MNPQLIAHGSGIDDVALILTPLVLFFVLRHLSRRKSGEPGEEQQVPGPKQTEGP